ncbi:MAG TPA: hypothetical protein VFV10_12835 [Gammaproteobacteria bacterium]|nr:hypothetical protein [Gammaproteobacteria bacterium]
MRYRLALTSDLQDCAALLPNAFKASAGVRARLPELWQRLIEVNAPNVIVIEDEGGLEGCAISAHVSGAFVDEALAEPKPHLSARFYEQMLAGRSVLSTPAEVRRANSSAGLNLLVLHFGLLDHDLSSERTRAALRSGSQAFYFFNGGYRYKLLVNEVYGRQAAEYMQAGGFRVLHEFERHGDAPADRSFLMGLRKEWVSMGAINEMGFLFDPPAPRFGFTPGEQRVLLRAMLTESDAEIAEHLGVSLDSVKKTWRRVFDRATSVAPYLFAAEGTGAGGGRSRGGVEARGSRSRARARSEQARGSEKRRYLLDYLRLHLEELRPHDTRPAGNGVRADLSRPSRSRA